MAQPARPPLVQNDHLELDTSELLNKNDQKTHQSLIGALQWVIQIGRFDITTTVMSLSRFHAMPRQGHLDRVKRIHGYLSKFRHATIKIRTDTPDYSNIPVKTYDWEYSCYSDAEEEIPPGSPEPKGKLVTMTLFFDANLCHNMITGKLVTGILHLFNQTLQKRQQPSDRNTWQPEGAPNRSSIYASHSAIWVCRSTGVQWSSVITSQSSIPLLFPTRECTSAGWHCLTIE